MLPTRDPTPQQQALSPSSQLADFVQQPHRQRVRATVQKRAWSRQPRVHRDDERCGRGLHASTPDHRLTPQVMVPTAWSKCTDRSGESAVGQRFPAFLTYLGLVRSNGRVRNAQHQFRRCSRRESSGTRQHGLSWRQMFEERSASIGIEFGENIVEQKNR